MHTRGREPAECIDPYGSPYCSIAPEPLHSEGHQQFIVGLPPGTLDRAPSVRTESSYWERSLESLEGVHGLSITYDGSTALSNPQLDSAGPSYPSRSRSTSHSTVTEVTQGKTPPTPPKSMPRYGPTNSMSSWVMPYSESGDPSPAPHDRLVQPTQSRTVRTNAGRFLKSLRSHPL